jgi:phage protein D
MPQIYVKIDGTNVSDAFLRNAALVTVESSLHLPDVATIRLQDPDGKWVDDASVAPGKALQIAAKAGNSQAPLFDGEIVEIEADFLAGDRSILIRAFDRLHRLARGRHVETYVNMNDGDIVRKIAREAGLVAKVGPTPTVHQHVFQDNVTHLDLLRERAAGLGFLLYVDSKNLHFEPLEPKEPVAELTFQANLREFHPRLTTIDQVTEVAARGWDPDRKVEVIGKANRGNGAPSIGVDGQGGAFARRAFAMPAPILVADRPIRVQALADGLAKAAMDRRVAKFVEAEGAAQGTPVLQAGVSVKLKEIGERFSGTYFVTAATHSYDPEDGYITRFVVSGFTPATLFAALSTERDGATTPRDGLVVGIVTDNKDPDNLGRVKVKFPWLSNDRTSNWARLVAPGAGKNRGIQFVPEVNDEVLVGFEQGNINYPYVLGGLWNKLDPPPRPSDQIIARGKVNERVIKTRTGHTVTIDDSDDKPGITIVDKTTKNIIKLESSTNKLTIHIEGDVVIEAPNGDIGLKGKTVTMEAAQAFKIKGMSVETTADQALKMKGTNAELEGTATVKAKGATMDLEASGKMGINGGAMLEAKGALIKLN